MTLEEVTPSALQNMVASGVLASFPYRCVALAIGATGFLIVPRLRLIGCQVRTVAWDGTTTPYMMEATLWSPGGPVALRLVHTLAPLPRYWKEWPAPTPTRSGCLKHRAAKGRGGGRGGKLAARDRGQRGAGRTHASPPGGSRARTGGHTIGQTAVAIPMVIATRRIRGPAAVQGIDHATVSGLAAGAAGAAVGAAVCLAAPTGGKLVVTGVAVLAASGAVIAFGVAAFILGRGDLRTVVARLRRLARPRA